MEMFTASQIVLLAILLIWILLREKIPKLVEQATFH